MSENTPARLKTVEWVDGALRLVDQRQLPEQLAYWDIDNVKDAFHAIRTLAVRGAPAIGIAAAYGLYLGVRDFPDDRTPADLLAYVDKNCRYLASSRPTAVNLSWALERLRKLAHGRAHSHTVAEIKQALLDEAHGILNEDRATCRAIGENGFELL